MLENILLDNAAAFCRHNDLMLETEGAQLLRPGLTTREYFQALMAQGCVLDARRVLSHVLPKRHALWWGLLCVWESCPQPAENVREVLAGVAQFIIEPTERRRRAVEELADLVRPTSSAYCLAMGAFLSGGSMSRPELPEVLPKPFLTGRLAGVAVYLAAVARAPLKYKQRLEQYIHLGLELARHAEPWRLPMESWTFAPTMEETTGVASHMFAGV